MNARGFATEAGCKLAVLGATGGTGRHIVRQALERGYAVTAVVRDPARLTVTGPGLTVATVTLSDPAALHAAVAGHSATISALGPRSLAEARAGVISSLMPGILDALHSADVRRLVAVSAGPVGDIPDGESQLGRRVVYPLVRSVFGPVYSDLAEVERLIRASPLEWTIVRPPRLTDRDARGYHRAIGHNFPNGRSLTRVDLARATLDALTDPATVRQAVGLAT